MAMQVKMAELAIDGVKAAGEVVEDMGSASIEGASITTGYDYARQKLEKEAEVREEVNPWQLLRQGALGLTFGGILGGGLGYAAGKWADKMATAAIKRAKDAMGEDTPFRDIPHENLVGDKLYPYKESDSWIKSFTVLTISDKVKLSLVNDITQNIVIQQNFFKEREYQYNYNPMEALESGEEYTHVSIDTLVKEDYEFEFQLLEYEDELDYGTPREDSIVWLQIGLMPKSKTKFLNTRAIIEEYGINPYFEALGTDEITFNGPGTSAKIANKMFGRPLTYEIGHQYSDYNAYGPYVWQWGKTDLEGKVSFNVSFNKDFLDDFTEIFGLMEGFNSIDDVVLYIRAFSSYFDWDDFAIDSPDQYIASKDGSV
ncbi:hypothetical protein LCGC14_2973480, partial [marine sediment metagenome]